MITSPCGCVRCLNEWFYRIINYKLMRLHVADFVAESSVTQRGRQPESAESTLIIFGYTQYELC